jgi:hypothetical protein
LQSIVAVKHGFISFEGEEKPLNPLRLGGFCVIANWRLSGGVLITNQLLYRLSYTSACCFVSSCQFALHE